VTQLGVEVTGIAFQNPVVLAAGTAAFGRALDGVVRLDALGGIVTKAVSLAPRKGNAAPRVAAVRDRERPACRGWYAPRAPRQA